MAPFGFPMSPNMPFFSTSGLVSAMNFGKIYHGPDILATKLTKRFGNMDDRQRGSILLFKLFSKYGFTLPLIAFVLCRFVPCQLAQAQGPAAEPPAVRVEAVTTVETSQPKSYPGFVTAKETVQIVPRVSGFLENVAFQEGALVKEGDLLFEIEDTVYEINVRVADAVVKQIEAEIALARRDLERTRQLFERKVVTDAEMDQAERTIALQEARLEEAKASLDRAKNDLSYTKIYAPLTGRIGVKQFSKGNYLMPGSGVMATIVQFDPVRIRLQASETDFITYLKSDYIAEHEGGAKSESKKVQIDILGPTRERYEGKFEIEFADNLVDASTGTITVFLICENKDMHFIPGGFTTIRLSERFEKPLPAVSVTAMMTDGVKDYVYVLDAENKAVRRDVVKGPQVFSRQTIASGLQPGDKVVVGGLNKVVPGNAVKPVEN